MPRLRRRKNCGCWKRCAPPWWGKVTRRPKASICAWCWPPNICRRSHALDLLEAFRRDVTKLRYRDWDDLIDYCRYSAMPVGRFVLDVHGESRDTWPANDALCAALQIINHLQDCAKDYRDLNRVYIPEDALAAAGVDITALAAPAASPALKNVVAGLARKNALLLEKSRDFGRPIAGHKACLGSRSHSNPRRRFERQTDPPRSAIPERAPLQIAAAALFLKMLPASPSGA